MLVGNKNNTAVRNLYKSRSDKAINYALSEIKSADIAQFVQHIYLYGSCARNEQSYGSDVDLLLELSNSFDSVDKRKKSAMISELRSRLSNHDNTLPEIEFKLVIGSQWKTDNTIFFANVRRDGIKLW